MWISKKNAALNTTPLPPSDFFIILLFMDYKMEVGDLIYWRNEYGFNGPYLVNDLLGDEVHLSWGQGLYDMWVGFDFFDGLIERGIIIIHKKDALIKPKVLLKNFVVNLMGIP